MADSELHSEEINAAGAWRERGRNPIINYYYDYGSVI